MKRIFIDNVKDGLVRTGNIKSEIITESHLENLPSPIKKYLHFSGVVGKEKINNMRVTMLGQIRSKPEAGWMQLESEQYNFFDKPTRVYSIKAKRFGIPAFGLHLYKEKSASFTIKILGFIKVIDARGEKLFQAETVTLFNDMCFLAPATLISKSIVWKEIDSLTADALFTNEGVTIRARLIFDEEGRLINFISNDRFDTNGKEYISYPWLTPVKEYGVVNGLNISTQISTDYQYPDRTFTYGEFIIKDIEYNLRANS